MKILKPGQFYTLNGVLYRAKKRTDGCIGCVLDSLIKCPNIVDRRTEKPEIDCVTSGTIFVRV